MANPKRVLFITHTAKLGGAEAQLLNLLDTLDRVRFSPVALLFSEGPVASILRQSVETHVLPLTSGIAETRKESLGLRSLLRISAIWNLTTFVIRIARFIRTQNIDLVHTNSLKSDIIGGISARIAGKPIIWHIRDRISSDYLPKPAVRAFRFLASVIPTHLITISQAIRQTLGKKLTMAKGRKVTVVLEGIKLFPPSPPPVRDFPIIGLIGRISPWKGQHVFVQAAALVHKHHPVARFRIIGAVLFGEHQYEQEVLRLREELGLQDVVEFAGFRNDIPACIADLDIVVHASTIGEPFGQVILEGMAAAKPVVATLGGGVPEIVEDGISGLLVPMGNVAAMADAIRSLLEDPDCARRLGLKARERVERVFDMKRVAHDVEEIFIEALLHA